MSGDTSITNYGRLVVVREKIWKRNFYGEVTSVEHRHARRERITRFMRLFAADEADAEGEGQALAAGEGAEIGGVDIVDDRVGILAVEDVDGFDADSPEIAAEAEFLFEADIEAGIGGEAGGVGRADELLLEINNAEGVAGAVLEEIA